MGIELTGPDEGPIPRPVYLELVCDGPHELAGELPPPTRFKGDGNGYVAQRKAATNQGWRFTGHGKVFGPCCPAAKNHG